MTLDALAVACLSQEIAARIVGSRIQHVHHSGIDSLAFLDIAFAIDKAFGIKLPLEKWTQEVNEGKVPAEEYFVVKNLVHRIDALVAAKAA